MTDDINEYIPESIEHKSKRTLFKIVFFAFLILIVTILSLGAFIYGLNQPLYFDGSKTISIESGESVPEITKKLQVEGIVKSSQLLYFVLATQFDPTKIKASRYVFDEPLTTLQVAERLISGDFDTDLLSITVFEGESREKMVERFATEFSQFDIDLFLDETEELEGQLFPDTYYIPEEFSTSQLVELLHSTYKQVISEYELEISNSNYTELEIITLASIVEREANTEESMRLVAGIFMNRLEIGMALQADASIEYVLEHDLKDLRPGQLAENLREIDSPYNTYLYPGLPPTPIGNPGRAAIEAVLYPTESNFLYYLTGDDGEFYYAKNYNQHLVNIAKHLR